MIGATIFFTYMNQLLSNVEYVTRVVEDTINRSCNKLGIT